jgi:hypothetical protein
MHTDAVTGKQWLFCGITEGAVIKAGYNENSPGLLQLDTSKELKGLGRVMAMVECNGSLYAAAGVDLVGTDTVGGLYRRIDGPNPSWELVYRWPYTEVTGDEANIRRGLTVVPAAEGSLQKVILGTRANPGVVERIDPNNNHEVTTELLIKPYFASAWNVPSYNGTALSAYNYFTPDTLDGNPVWWMSLWVSEAAGNQPPTNGAHFLVRSVDGSYRYQKVYDFANPVPAGQNLRAIRTICKSPFPQDSGTYFMGGYDCARDTSKNTAWIYKGVLASIPTEINEKLISNSISIYPNPTNSNLFIKTENHNSLQYIVTNSIGQVIKQANVIGDRIEVSWLQRGIYFIQLKDDTGKYYASKFFKN